MAAIRNLLCYSRQLISPMLLKEIATKKCIVGQRMFSITVPSCLRKIEVHTENDVTIVEGTYIEPEQNEKVFVPDVENAKDFCPLCPNRLSVDVKYTDVLILSQFLRADGCVLPKRVTGLCSKAQLRLQRLIHQAQRAGLMPEHRPDFKNGRQRNSLHSPYKWKRFNAYFDE